MDVLLHLEPNPTPFHCRWDRFHFECCLLPLKPNLSFSAAVLEDENRAFTWAILLVRASFIHQNQIALRLGGGLRGQGSFVIGSGCSATERSAACTWLSKMATNVSMNCAKVSMSCADHCKQGRTTSFIKNSDTCTIFQTVQHLQASQHRSKYIQDVHPSAPDMPCGAFRALHFNMTPKCTNFIEEMPKLTEHKIPPSHNSLCMSLRIQALLK